MGLFSTKKKTVVSSAIYNLAGDKIEDFLRQAILESVFLEETQNFSAHLPKAILNSEGFKIRRYISWCKKQPKGKEYCDLIGHMYISYGSTLEGSVLETLFRDSLDLPESQAVYIDFIELNLADYSYWGAKYLAENYPQYTDETLYSFVCDLNNQTITIHVFDINQTEINTFSFTPTDYDPDEYYLYIAYQIYDLMPIYQEDDEGHLVYDENHNRIIIGYTRPESWTEDLTYLIYARNTSSTDPNYNIAFEDLFNALDTNVERDTFILPPVPFRLDNWQVSSAEEVNVNDWKLYQLSKTACFKIFQDRSVYKKLNKTILENPSIDDLDYIYLVFGVSLNTKNWAGKQYLYETIASLYTQYVNSGVTYIDIKAHGYRSNFEYRISWNEIEFGTMDVNEEVLAYPDVHIPFQPSPENQEPIQIFTNSKDKYAVFQTVSTATKTNGSGRTHTYFVNGWTYFVHRKTVNSTQYSYYRVKNLIHYNRVHKNKEVRTLAQDAWYQKFTESVYERPTLKTKYEESPFIFPLQEDIYRKLPVLTQAQLSMSFAYLQFNCYEIQKIKWYQSAWFRTVIAVVILVIQAVTFYFSVGTTAAAGNAAGSATGSAASSAASAGLSQTAAQAVTQLIKMAATALIGTLVAKATIAILRALGVNNIIANIVGTIAGICAASSFGSWMEGLSNEATLSQFGGDGTDAIMQDVVQDTAVEVTAVANTTSVPTIFTLFKDGMFNFLTSPMKILNFSLSVTESAVKGYYQDKFDELNKLAKQVSSLQKEVEKQEKLLADLSASSYSEWQKQMMLHKIQTSIRPEIYFTFSLMTGSEIADLTINSLDAYLDMSATLEYV